MGIKEIRIENLRRLVTERGTIAAVADSAGTNEKYLWQILNGIEQRGTRRGVGDKLAKRLESGNGKPEGWMDRPHLEAGEEDVRDALNGLRDKVGTGKRLELLEYTLAALRNNDITEEQADAVLNVLKMVVGRTQ